MKYKHCGKLATNMSHWNLNMNHYVIISSLNALYRLLASYIIYSLMLVLPEWMSIIQYIILYGLFYKGLELGLLKSSGVIHTLRQEKSCIVNARKYIQFRNMWFEFCFHMYKSRIHNEHLQRFWLQPTLCSHFEQKFAITVTSRERLFFSSLFWLTPCSHITTLHYQSFVSGIRWWVGLPSQRASNAESHSDIHYVPNQSNDPFQLESCF